MYARFRRITRTLLSCFLPSDVLLLGFCNFVFLSMFISATNLPSDQDDHDNNNNNVFSFWISNNNDDNDNSTIDIK